MRDSAFNLAAAAYALAVAATVIIAADYFESLPLLVGQLIFIAGPTLTALLAARWFTRPAWLTWPLAVLLPLGGWAETVWIDTRPYVGGGASLAMLSGWLGCGAAVSLILLIAAIRRAADRTISEVWRRPPHAQ